MASNPIFISLFSAVALRQMPKWGTVGSLLVCTVGVTVAAWPLLRNSTSTPGGLILLLVAMIVYSGGVFYFSHTKWNDLSILVINGWQVLFAAVFILPVVLLTGGTGTIRWSVPAILSVAWQAIPVSIVAVQCWLYLLRTDEKNSAFWLFLCPLFGYGISNIFTHEPLTIYTFAGMALVLIGMYWQRRQ